ncbi:MAG TPA: hypothetical protein VL981_09500 [Candidatus Methylacidiphilales bacterium]|nr:hypothetical protein [Candidatus Methylacidiphilales bacterium]
MKPKFYQAIGILFVTLGAGTLLRADLNDWARQAISPDQSTALSAQNSLRETGPAGLEALEQCYAGEIQNHRNSPRANDDRWERITAALNRVGGQYDDYASGLYWYTDLGKAEAAAQTSGKPILSLRLLGRLDEELSCANSRFFRATLYSNARISQMLRDKFILHWESVRPVPIVTIDFGDGRKLMRTITGNSIHYILDTNGRAVDALPGLYGAQTFLTELQSAADAVAQEKQGVTPVAHQGATIRRLLAAWKADLSAVSDGNPDLNQANETTLENMTDDTRWRLIAQRHISEASFDPSSSKLILSKFPTAVQAAPLTASKMMVESPMLTALRNMQKTVSVDTVRDNYMLRPKILGFLQASEAHRFSLAEINNWVYAQIFLTPKDDPWLGLAPQDVFSGIAENGEVGP